MITIYLNKDSSKPLYMQIYERIREDIIDRKLKPGTLLPSKRELASHLNVSVKTVENAYYQLLIEGYVYARERSGTYVARLDHYRREKHPRKEYIPPVPPETCDIDLKSNTNPVFPMNTFRKTIKHVVDDDQGKLLETAPFNGMPEIRRAIADHLQDFRNMDISPAQIITGCGTEYLYSRLIQLWVPVPMP